MRGTNDRRPWRLAVGVLALALPGGASAQEAGDATEALADVRRLLGNVTGPVTAGHVDSGGVPIFYASAGQGPLVVLIHGFPDFWYTWRNQIPELSRTHQVVAIDLRGYDRSGKPAGVEAYRMERLIEDVKAVITHFRRERATLVGHDWGGAIAWTFAMTHPELTERLVLLNMPHPRGLLRELATNPEQQRNSQYARDFQDPAAASALKPETMAFWVTNPEVRSEYIKAFKRSSIEGMLNYYNANYPRPPYVPADREYPKVRCPVLVIHGLEDQALLPAGLNGTWDLIDDELTIVTIPKAGHFVQHDAAARVTTLLTDWLARTAAGQQPR